MSDSPGDRALHLLATVFGHPAFRGAQAEIVSHVAAGGDALVLMPTGGGKSLCYQLPALLRGGTALVVSPLIALMQDQVAALREAGVRAAFLNSSLPAAKSRVAENLLEDSRGSGRTRISHSIRSSSRSGPRGVARGSGPESREESSGESLAASG